ncbi:MAG: chemotaxis protein CheW [Tissierellaceae bacterium]|nr:chemotaxis protein CheW [Tissierellaceae bacterium]
MERQYVTFTLNEEEYGVEIKNVQEITDFDEYTKIPDGPKFLLGMVNIRGTITPIIDLKKRFNISRVNGNKEKRVIIINIKDKQIGFLIDDASRVLRLNDNQIDNPPDIISRNIRNYVIGIGKVDEKLILILDLEKILTAEEKEEALKAVE